MDGSNSEASELALEELEAQITELCGHLNAAQYRWLVLIREFDRRVGWGDGKLASCAHWLNFKCGLNLGAAREKVRVAHALQKLPLIAASMGRGELSYSKVRALTRVACRATERDLLNIALHGTAYHVEKTVRLYRRALQVQELSREASQQESRSVSYYWEEDGSLVLKARLPAVGGALVVKALEAALAQVPEHEVCMERSEEWPLSHAARRADALVRMAESALKAGGRDAKSAEHYQVVIHVDAQSLSAQAPGRAEVEGGPSLAVETIKRLGCDASVVGVIEDGKGQPLSVGRRTRSIPPAIRRALRARDESGCQFPGCTYERYLDAHHIEHWAHGGRTELSNLVTLCRWHHRLVHEGGIGVQARPRGGWRFVRTDGQEFAPLRRDPRSYYRGTELEEAHRAQGLEVTETTAATRWRGERMDYDLGVMLLCHQAERAREQDQAAAQPARPDVSAETSDRRRSARSAGPASFH
jgi:Domain of unknown function (DUF222)/HNH endonuclease